MAEQDRIEQLDAAVEAILSGRRAEAADAEMDGLLAVVSDLREVADPRFKALLKWKLIPRELHTVAAHFTLPRVPDFITFLEDAFGGREEFRAVLPDGRVAHAVVRIGDSTIEMGDAGETVAPTRAAMHLYVDNVDEVYERALAAGGTSLHPVVNQFYGDREGSIADSYGNRWYIATHLEPGQPVPPGLRMVTPFLHPRGVDRMIDFLSAAFGAQPIGEPYKTPDGLIAHAVMRIGDSVVEMGEHAGAWKPTEAGIHLYVDDADAVYRQAVAAGATSVYPPYDAPYGERTSQVIDPFGNRWYIGTPKRRAGS